MDPALTHVSESGSPHMVDVSAKPVTPRRAVASGRVLMLPATRQLALAAGGPKGPVIEVARLAGIQAAKRTADLIPLCHTLPLDGIEVRIEASGEDALAIEATVTTTWKTGVEMEALTAVAVAGLTIIDMLKAVEKGLVITDIRMEAKSGGRSGNWTRPTEPSSS